MKKKVIFAVGMIGVLFILTSFILVETSDARAISASKVEVTFTDGTTAFGTRVTPFLDAKGRTCATIDLTGQVIGPWTMKRMTQIKRLAFSCTCGICGCGFSTRTSGVCCVNCICCGNEIHNGFCHYMHCTTCCCTIIILDE
jgi:hypothetical protein